MKKYLLHLLFCLPFYLNAQTSVEGTITMGKDPIIGATVVLVNTDFGAVTDLQGRYSISDVPSGRYTLEASYLGAETYLHELIVAKDEIMLDIKLQPASHLIEQIMVTAESDKRKQEKKAMQIESVEIGKLQSSVKDLSDALDQLSGVRVRSSGGLGSKSDIALNGLNGSAVRTYIDGLPMEFVYPNSSLGNLPMNTVKRIDVYKGVLPIEIGTDAMGGGINVLPEYKNINALKASYSFGSYNTHKIGVNTSWAIDQDITLNAAASYVVSDNDYSMRAYVWEDGEERDVNRFHDAYRLGLGEIGLVVRKKAWADFFRVNASYTDYYKEQQHGGVINRIAYGDIVYSGNNKNALLDYRKAIGERIEFRTALAYSYDVLSYRDTSALRYSWSGAPIGKSIRGEFNEASDSKRHQHGFVNRSGVDIDLGYDYTLSITNLFARQRFYGRDEEKTIERDILTKDQQLTKNIAGLGLRKFLWDNRIELSTALKYYLYKLDAVDFKAFSPIEQVDDIYGYYGTAKYNLNKEVFIRSSYEKAWRIPTYEQFFGNGINIIPNPNLKPESSHNINLGIGYTSNIASFLRLKAEANFFQRNQSDIIFLTSTLRARYTNAEKVSTKGVELEVATTFWDKLEVRANITKLMKRYDEISDSNISGKFLEDTPFPNTPSLFGNIQINYSYPDFIYEGSSASIYVHYKYVDEFNYINVGKIRNDNNWIPVQNRTNIGCTYSLENGRYQFSFNINNVFNRTLYDNYRIPRPRRNYNARIVYNINQY